MHFLWRTTIRLGLLLIFLACLALWGASAAANYYFGIQQCGDGQILAYVCGGASIASDIMKAAVVFALIWAWRTRHFLAGLACLVVAAVTITYSLISATSFYSWMTADVRAERTIKSATNESRIAEMRSLEAALAEARIAAVKDQYRRDRQAASDLAKELQARIDWLRGEIKISPAISGADPTVQFASKIGVDPGSVPVLRLIFFVALLELGSALSLTAFSQLFAHGVPIKPPRGGGGGTPHSKPEFAIIPNVDPDAPKAQRNAAQAVAFLRQLIHDGDGGREIAAEEVQARYIQWCAQTHQPTMTRNVLGKQLSSLDVKTRRGRYGRVYVIPDSIGARHLRVVA